DQAAPPQGGTLATPHSPKQGAPQAAPETQVYNSGHTEWWNRTGRKRRRHRQSRNREKMQQRPHALVKNQHRNDSDKKAKRDTLLDTRHGWSSRLVPGPHLLF